MNRRIIEAVRCKMYGYIWQVTVMGIEEKRNSSNFFNTIYLATIDKIEEWLNYMPETVESMEYLLLEKFKGGWTPPEE